MNININININIKIKLINLYVKVCRILFGVNKNKVMFTSFGGKSYSDNPRAISEKLHAMLPDAEIVWEIKEPEKKSDIVPAYIRCIDCSKLLSYYKEFATSSVYVTNNSMLNISKSKKQMFIQTWHGDRAFKKILYDSGYKRKYPLAESVKGYCDYAIAGSEYGIMQYRSAFKFEGEVIADGTPRNDRLISQENEYIKEIKRKLNINNKKVLLYAPTLREAAISKKENQKIQDIDLLKTIEALEQKYNCEWVCFVRAHSVVQGLCGVDLNDKIIDVSYYDDMADLLLISDMLITDYSSCAGDFALLKRPLVLYQSDRKEYEENDRGFYFKMEDSPYHIAENQEELEKIILELDEDSIDKNCEDILEFYGTNETGKASEVVAGLIINHIKKVQ